MKKLLAILLVLCMSVSLFACGSQPAAPAQSSSAAPSESAKPSESSEPAKAKKVGIAAAHYTNSWNIVNTENALEVFEGAGFEVVWNEAKNDTATQVANVNDLIAQGIDYLLIKPKEEEGLVPAMEACKKAGVKVILLDRTVKGTPGVDFVTGIRTNAKDGGARVGQWVVDNYPNGANIVEITGTPGATTSLDRTSGFASVIGKDSKFVMLDSQVGNFMRSDAQTAAENLIQAYGDKIDIIVSQSDEMTFGVLQAIDGMGLTPGKDITVVTIGDGSSAMLDEVIAGRVAAVSECTPYLAQTALEVVKKIEAGEKVETNMWANDRFFTIENAAAEQAKATW